MKTHVAIGAQTLESVYVQYPRNTFLEVGITIARSHHEKWDGSGYPEGLKGDDIPLSGRIMALADVYDALRSKRVYKEAFSHEKTCNILREGSGTHFDPAVIDAFLSIEAEFAEIRDRMDDNQ